MFYELMDSYAKISHTTGGKMLIEMVYDNEECSQCSESSHSREEIHTVTSKIYTQSISDRE